VRLRLCVCVRAFCVYEYSGALNGLHNADALWRAASKETRGGVSKRTPTPSPSPSPLPTPSGTGTPTPPPSQEPQAQSATAAAVAKGARPYRPQPGSGAHALLKALWLAEAQPGYIGHLSKAELLAQARAPAAGFALGARVADVGEGGRAAGTGAAACRRVADGAERWRSLHRLVIHAHPCAAAARPVVR
jgi:hypothetical protein